MDMPKPTAAHRKLERIVGHWRGEERMHPSPWSPQGGTATGHSRGRLALDGFAVIVDYEQESGGHVTFRGHGVYTYDAQDGCYVLHWFDSMGSRPEVFRGGFEGDVLMVSRSGPEGHFRLSWQYSGTDRMTTVMETSPDGSAWSRLMDGAYAREE
ncbi:MAG: hypothetical protein A2W00_14985 [Candidatus Eisenbacteria bacterium RBG_16_71_46]|nr:MAG: hypothetical protein A2W00_14985 [Candidatus Eisenbacteria bacterium RBG_16_71_46]OGF24064.1 MAG: hypothetical protein A2V63_08010 [Candidatus Eisenbacteria bacterium RBG_19FT_COMBO_70_11]